MLDHGAAPPVEESTTRKTSALGALTRRKPVEQLVAEGGQGEGGNLRRSLSMWQLTMISIGATLGTGIFVVLGDAVPVGPAVTVAFVIMRPHGSLLRALVRRAGRLDTGRRFLVLVRLRNDG